jgi:AGZA family xanthine/uracil permease-like MFS transporter
LGSWDNLRGSNRPGLSGTSQLAIIFGKVSGPEQIISTDLSISATAFQLDIIGAVKWSLFGSIFTLTFIDMFDSIGTLLAVAPAAGLMDAEGRIKELDRLLTIDATATMLSAICGTSPATAYIESAAGVEQGGRTGLTAIVTGVLFLAALLFVPLVGIVPPYATAGALIMVGLFMMKEVKKIDFSDLPQALPAFIIIVMIALSYSISTGLAFGFIAYTLIQIIAGKIRTIKPTMWIITLLSVAYFCV